MDEMMNVNEGIMEVGEVTRKPNLKAVLGLAIGATGVVGLGIFLAIKCKQRIEKNQLKRLEQQGYILYKPEEPINVDVDDCEE